MWPLCVPFVCVHSFVLFSTTFFTLSDFCVFLKKKSLIFFLANTLYFSLNFLHCILSGCGSCGSCTQTLSLFGLASTPRKGFFTLLPKCSPWIFFFVLNFSLRCLIHRDILCIWTEYGKVPPPHILIDAYYWVIDPFLLIRNVAFTLC